MFATSARPFGRAALLVALLLLTASCGGATQVQSSPTPVPTVAPTVTPAPTPTPIPAPADLVAAGKVRIIVDPTSPAIGTRVALGDYKGPGWDVALELGKRMGVKVEAVEGIGTQVDAAAEKGLWDVAIIVVNAATDAKYGNAGSLLRIELGYLVPSGSAIKSAADADKAGVRITTLKTGSAYPMLQSVLKNAKLVDASSMDDMIAKVKNGEADTIAYAKPRLGPALAAIPGSKIVDGYFGTTDYGFYSPQGKAATLAYLKDFAAAVKKDGFLKAACDKAAITGLTPAP